MQLLERAHDLHLVEETVHACLGGRGGFLVIEGTSGIGKSSLLLAGRTRAQAAGMNVLHARASELEQTFAYGLVRQLLEPVVMTMAPRERTHLFREAATHAAPLFEPSAVGRAPASEDEAFALVHGLYWLMVNLSEDRPTMVVVDDVQWSDAASLRWLGYLTRRIDGHDLVVLAAARPRPADEHPLLAELLANPSTTVVRPRALSVTAVATLVRETLGEHAEEEFWLECHRATGGNPLLVHELLRALAADGIAPTAPFAHIASAIAPDAVTRSVNLRLSRLSEGTEAVARAVAMLGDGVDPAYVAELADVDRTELAQSIADLTRVDLLASGGPARFAHPLLRNAVYERVAPSERLRAHARAADVLTSHGAPLEAVASQLLQAPPQSTGHAVAVLREAAAQAAARGARESAATYLERALEEHVDEAEKLELLVELARAEISLGRASGVPRLREVLALGPSGPRARELVLTLASALFWWRQHEEALSLLEEALAGHEVTDDYSRRVEATLLAIAVRHPTLRMTVEERLRALDVDDADEPGTQVLLGVRAFVDATRGRWRERAVADAERALTLGSRETGDVVSVPYGRALYVLLFADRLDEIVRLADASIKQSRRSGHAFDVANASAFRARAQFFRAEVQDAEADARLAAEALPNPDTVLTSYIAGILALVLVERGALDEAAGIVYRLDLGSFDALTRTPLLWARTAVAAARGDHRSALAEALAAREISEGLGFVNPAFSTWRSDAALAHHFLGAHPEALELARSDVELAQQWGAPRSLGRGLRVLGIIEGGEKGIDHLRRAVEVLEGSQARLEYLYALTYLGSGLRRRNRRAEARDPLRRALDGARRGGVTRLAEIAHDELVATGARPRRLSSTGVDALTPSERRIATMATSGRSNREIAQNLFVTLRTVEMHMSNVFRKLGISARTQLPAALGDARPGETAAGTSGA
jgi:DNA-binding CsgD family transcriptional regulator/tetratricopeptide (TPR) repeat protein